MRAMTEWRRRRMSLREGGSLLLFFGARTPEELPYFGPLTKLPKEFIDVNMAFSRVRDRPKQYVQDLIRDAHLADVMQDRTAADLFKVIVLDAHGLGDLQGGIGHAA